MPTYYVTTTGSDSADGSQATPWLTATHAAATAVSGDTVIFGAGTFDNGTSPANFVDGVSLTGAGPDLTKITSNMSETATGKGTTVRVGGTVTVSGISFESTNAQGAPFGFSIQAGQTAPADGSVITVHNCKFPNKIDGLLYVKGTSATTFNSTITYQYVACSAVGGFDNVQTIGFAAASAGSIVIETFVTNSTIDYTIHAGQGAYRGMGASGALAKVRMNGGTVAVAGDPNASTYFANPLDPHTDPGNFKGTMNGTGDAIAGTPYTAAFWTEGAGVEGYGVAVTLATGYDDTTDTSYGYQSDPAGFPSVPTTFDAIQLNTGTLKAYSCTGITKTQGTITTGHCPQFASSSVSSDGLTLTLTFTSADTGTLANLDSTKFTVAGQTLSAGAISGLTVTHTLSPGMSPGTSAALGIGYQGVKDGNGVSVQAIHPLQGVVVSRAGSVHGAHHVGRRSISGVNIGGSAFN